MKTATALWNHVCENDLCPGANSLVEWRNVRWIRVRIGERALRFLPVIGYRAGLHIHDVHHVLTGYSTRLVGELELAAWELASGGCHRHVFFWVDRILAIMLGAILYPRRIWRASRRGRACRNAYGWRPEDLLATDLADLCQWVGVKPAGVLPGTRTDVSEPR